MKFFGWGKSKDPQPQTVLQHSAAIKPDARNGSHGALDRSKTLSGMGSIMPSKGTTTGIRKKQELFGVDNESYLHSNATSISKTSTDVVDADSEDQKLQEKIRFVFSHEREGLLAIGTFALEQLQSMRTTIDGHEKAALLDSTSTSTAASASALNDLMAQSSDDEDQLQRRWVAARKTCDLPVFGDSESENHNNNSKALALSTPHRPDRRSPNPSSDKPMVLLTALPPELRRALDPANALLYGKSFLIHWTDAVPPSNLQLANPPANPTFGDEDYYTSRLCGLFSKKKSSVKSKRGGEIVPAVGDDRKRIVPIELAAQEAKKSMLRFAAPGVPSLGKLAKLWRASCKQPTARIAPERKPYPEKNLPAPADQPSSGEVFTTPAPSQVKRPANPKVEEFRKRLQEQERMGLNAPGQLRDGVASSRLGDCGHWIKDDEDFFVLEM